MLIGVEALGAISGGAQRWLDLGLIRLQPSELMKPCVVLVAARFYDMIPAREIRSWQAIWPALLLIGVPAALILVQPDLGTAVMVGLGGVTVMFLSGLPMRLFLGAAAAAAVILPTAYEFLLEEYQQQRVTIFLNPENDALGAGWNIRQAAIAIGSGGLSGKGFLSGTQSHLQYLPELHTDFIFATMAEEWGLAGMLFVLGCYAVILGWGLSVALRARTQFGRLTALGLTCTLFFYVFINMSMVMGFAPVVGIPLPLMSYGGSAMMTAMILIGMLLSIDRQRDLRMLGEGPSSL
jgi:rod shape determining protein RodA